MKSSGSAIIRFRCLLLNSSANGLFFHLLTLLYQKKLCRQDEQLYFTIRLSFVVRLCVDCFPKDVLFNLRFEGIHHLYPPYGFGYSKLFYTSACFCKHQADRFQSHPGIYSSSANVKIEQCSWKSGLRILP